MSFWAYLLHCRDGAFYAGHSDNLEMRLAQHQAGAIKGYTAERLPVELVWSREFGSRFEALTAERQIKGWSRAKKLALIRGDWDPISLLAEGKDSPSTSSGRTAGGGTMTSLISLVPHRDHPPLGVSSIRVECWYESERWHFRYLVDGAAQLVLPDPAEPGRADQLWRTTCFEAFVGGEGAAYREYNFAPSGQWAAYAFDGPRHGMRNADGEVEVLLAGGEDWIAVEAAVSADLVWGLPLNFSAVIEEKSGHKSYWALAHPDGPPDFHDRDCFIANLPPVELA